ncbi:hypothetical protein [Streptomyces anulatus]|uniref:hypothetical protein n=1 Tax=Streptomyces anulatus TaxID=1892 RepID=UPI003F4DB646
MRDGAEMARAEWRSPSGAAEDRNVMDDPLWGLGSTVAVALRGDRGSQRYELRVTAR